MPTPRPRAITREIASTIKGRMAKYNVTQGEMAAAVGVDQSQLSKMIRGIRQINIDQLERMCHMLDLEIEEVVAEAANFVNERIFDDEPWIEPFVMEGERVEQVPASNVVPLRNTPTEEEAIEELEAVANVTEHEQPEIDEPGPEEGA